MSKNSVHSKLYSSLIVTTNVDEYVARLSVMTQKCLTVITHKKCLTEGIYNIHMNYFINSIAEVS